jgi:hypothetical protein
LKSWGKKIIIYNTILEHYRGGGRREPLCLIIQGTIGTGKFYLIVDIKYAMEIDSLPNKGPSLLLAPTCVVAFNISKSTIHSTLCIPLMDMNYLQGSRLIAL